MALTRSKRGGRQAKTTPRKSQVKKKDKSFTQKKDGMGSLDRDGPNFIEDTIKEQLVSASETSRGTAALPSETGDLTAAGTSGERAVAPLMGNEAEDEYDSDLASNDSFPQFVIDAKPDSRLNAIDDDDDDDDDGDSDADSDSSSVNLGFVIDKIGGTGTGSAHERDGHREATLIDEQVEVFIQTPAETDVRSQESRKKTVKGKKKSKSKKEESLVSLEAPCEIDVGLDLGDCYINLDGEAATSSKPALENVLLKSQQDKLIKKSVLTPDFEKKHSIPPYKVGMRQLKKQRKKERESTKGDGWYGMKAPEMTEQLRNDIKIIRMRSTLDPKRFYKGNDMAAIPKFVQVGTVVDSPVDFYHSRVPKKQRKETLVEELLADADTRRYNKRKYLELQERFNSFTKGGKKKFGKKNVGRKR